MQTMLNRKVWYRVQTAKGGVHIRWRIRTGGGPNPLWHRHSRKEIRAEIPAATSIFTFMNQVSILKDKILDKK